MSATRSALGRIGMIMAAFAVVITSFAPAFSATTSAEWSAPRTVYFQETGHSLDQYFLDHWRSNSGWANYGLPITEEIELDNGVIVQYLQYARFEYWPEGDADGNYFKLGKVGEDLRPNLLQRSMIASTQNPGNVTGVTDLVKAWLPVSSESALAQDPDVTYVEATRHTVFGAFRDFWWSTGDVNYLGNPLTQEYNIKDTTYQVFEYGQLSWNAEAGVKMVPVGKLLANKYQMNTDVMAQGDIPTYDESLFVKPGPTYGQYVAGGGEVWVDINLSWQYMTVYQGNNILFETYISSGKDGWETPAGTFYVNTMLRYDTMVGDNVQGESWNVPDVPHVLYFTNSGHAIHGTYWHNSFGTRLSHGCINVNTDLAAYLFSIAYVGMRIEIHY